MRTSTYLILFVAFILFIAGPARAQVLPPLPIPIPGGCDYDDPNGCYLFSYESIQEPAPGSEDLLIVISATLNEGETCSEIDGVFVATTAGEPEFYTREVLADNPFIQVTVNRAAFLANPTLLVSLYTNIPIPLPDLPDFNIRYPIAAVALRAESSPENPNVLCTPITPLPVELISFEGKATAGGIALEWSTASEKDNSHFEVERSADGQTFEQVGKVNGNGNSSVKRRYTFTDTNPASELNYYRLKQVDFDGKYEYSKVITVTADALASSELSINLAPNPCQDGDCSAIIANPGRSGAINLELKDMSGRVILTKTVAETNGGTLKIPMKELAPHKGLFILTATSGNSVVHKRVVLK